MWNSFKRGAPLSVPIRMFSWHFHVGSSYLFLYIFFFLKRRGKKVITKCILAHVLYFQRHPLGRGIGIVTMKCPQYTFIFCSSKPAELNPKRGCTYSTSVRIQVCLAPNSTLPTTSRCFQCIQRLFSSKKQNKTTTRKAQNKYKKLPA